jgi:two-component system sensor histidine kinase RegB
MLAANLHATTELATPALQTRLSALVQIRWLAVAGQLVTIIVVEYSVGGLPMLPVLAAVGASILFNIILALHGSVKRISEEEAAFHLSFDTLQLGMLLAMTGGLQNPFAIFLLAPITIGASILSPQRLALLVGLSVVALSAMGLWAIPLPIVPGSEEIFVLGTWLAISIGIVSVSFFTWRIAEEVRNTAGAYSEARIALAQEERMADLGALAAAVAHEVNTPLATICLVAEEIKEQLPTDSGLLPEIMTLIAQASRCRDTLAKLTSRKERDSVVEQERISLPSLVEMAAQLHAENSDIPIYFDHHEEVGYSGMPAPWVTNKLEILHGLSNFILNALQFARSRVEIDTSWNSTSWTIRIIDDGPGFAQHVLERLGEPYVSGRSQDSQSHLGLGIFIAKSLLVRLKAEVSFRNSEDGGAEVMIAWKNVWRA